MIERRPFNQLAGEDHGWLRAKRHISSADCHDATRVGRGSLRVWNNDEIAPKAGLSPHPHADIRARVLEGRQAIEYALGERRHGCLVPASVNGVRPSTRPVGFGRGAFHGKVARAFA
jgi:redox-sensitive bicupin YhaK (pirin superfamily)